MSRDQSTPNQRRRDRTTTQPHSRLVIQQSIQPHCHHPYNLHKNYPRCLQMFGWNNKNNLSSAENFAPCATSSIRYAFSVFRPTLFLAVVLPSIVLPGTSTT
ncbi:hypothetical protein CEXT_66061 [Caerostris extrusa]|uniref:Uncharacterized protein n=1 Tax=Caerostris extrusa TaxID=172846 RepID=A0AAV4M9Y5_CAEEX|nr:hypothetical protein CEXT_66061 [Caerostris extrusa]